MLEYTKVMQDSWLYEIIFSLFVAVAVLADVRLLYFDGGMYAYMHGFCCRAGSEDSQSS